MLSENNIAVFILAGGRSSRMGHDKAFIELEGKTLIARMLETASTISREIVIVGNAEKYAKFGRTVEDIYRDCGPLGGIHAALASSATDYNLMLAVDMPFIPHQFLTFLAAQARSNQSVVTVPETDGRLQPLCAMYRKSFLEIADRALTNGQYKITSLFAQVKTHVITNDEIEDSGFSTNIFKNWNTPADIEAGSLLTKRERL